MPSSPTPSWSWWLGETTFSTIGACSWENVGLVCAASLSERATPLCKSREDGVRACRLSTAETGAFELAQKPAGLAFAVRERLELAGPLDGISFLYINADNPDHRAFLLQPAPPAACQ